MIFTKPLHQNAILLKRPLTDDLAFLVRHYFSKELHTKVDPQSVSITCGLEDLDDDSWAIAVFVHSPGVSYMLVGAFTDSGQTWLTKLNEKIEGLVRKVFKKESVFHKIENA